MAMTSEEKLARLCDLYQAPMLQLARRIVEERQDAEDVVQNAFESVAKNLDHLAAPDNPKTRGYLMVVTERKAIDLIRARRKIESTELDENAVIVEFPDIGEHSLAWCMTKLPPRYREILLLRFVYGYSMWETADLMDIPHTTVGKLSQRAKERLYEICRKEGIL